MTENLERPKFLSSFFSAMAERAEAKTLWRMFVVPFVAGTFSAGVAYNLPSALWSEDSLPVATTVYIGVLTLNGLILALSWSAFSRIYESISAPKFCSFLRRNNLLNNYIVTISFIHGLQLFSIIASAAGLIVLLFRVSPVMLDRVMFGTMAFGSIYAIQKAASAVAIMNDLLWQKSIFDEHHEAADNSKVVPLNNRGE